jgi:hypothetical protein
MPNLLRKEILYNFETLYELVRFGVFREANLVYSEDRGSMLLRNVYICITNYSASLPIPVILAFELLFFNSLLKQDVHSHNI